MAAGEGRSDTLRCYLRQSLAFLRSEKDLSSLPDNSTDFYDAYSDSDSEYKENSRNVMQWLQSLPADNQWCEAEEQIGRTDSSEALVDGISSIGDSDAPITLKSQAGPRAESVSVKKLSKDKKYRRGALHANSSLKEAAKNPKKSTVSREKRASKKSKKSLINPEISKITDDLEKQSANTACTTNIEFKPVFNNSEFGKMLDEAMSRAINKYKRSERTWEPPKGSKIAIGAYEPPSKRSKPPSFQYSANINYKK